MSRTVLVTPRTAEKRSPPPGEPRDFPAVRVWELLNDLPQGGGSPRRARLADPSDVAFDRTRNRLYVSSAGHRHIVVVNAADGQPVGYLGPRIGRDELRLPLGLAIDGAGNIVVVDQGQAALFVIAPDGTLRRRIPVAGKGFEKPPRLMDAAVHRDGRIFVTDNANGKVLVLNAAGKILGRWGNTGDRPGDFAGIGAIEITADGNDLVFVAEGIANRVTCLRLLPQKDGGSR